MNLRQYLPEGFPTITVLCGSTRYADAYREANRSETLAGRIVLSVGLLGHQEGLDMNGPVKEMLDKLHLRKVELADAILVLDCDDWTCSVCGQRQSMKPSHCCGADLSYGPYVGISTSREIEHARSLGKNIRFWSKEHGRTEQMPGGAGAR
jgi:hypothetical protein